MPVTSSDASSRRLLHGVEAVAGVWLVLLPLLRPVLWSGQPTDVPNLFFLVLLAAAITTGFLLRGLEAPPIQLSLPWWWRPAWWGVAFVGCLALGSVASPLPAEAWTLTVGWVLHLAAPWALWPAIRRRPHLVVAGLAAGLVGELFLMIGQVLWERPQLAAQLARDPTLTVEQRVADQFQARIGSWRLEGTFLLANTLATYLLLMVPLMIALAWRCRSAGTIARWGTRIVAGAALVALGMSGSKAGILALVIAAAITLVVELRSWRWRAAAVLLVLLLISSAVFIPSVRSAVFASAGVRIDYWRAGGALVAERPLTGHGLEGFSVQYPRVKPPEAEETVLAHQETLQAAVDLGIPAAVVLVAWWIALLFALRPPAAQRLSAIAPTSATGGLRRSEIIGVSLAWLFSCAAAGVLSANFAVYPGGVPWLWSIALIAVMLLVADRAARLPLPPSVACWCAVLAVLLHVQADFSLHSMQVVGVLAWLAFLGLALQAPSLPVERVLGTQRRQTWHAIAGLAVLMAVTLGVVASSMRGEVRDRAREAESLLTHLRVMSSQRVDEAQRQRVIEAFEHAVSRIVVQDREAALAADPREALAMGHIRRCVEESRRFPADHDLIFTAVALGEHLQALVPVRASILTPMLERMHAEWPGDLLVIKSLSEHYLRLARASLGDTQRVQARQAQAMAHRAVELYPTHLPLRQTLITAAELTGDQATSETQRAEIARLTPLVHPDNRPR